MLLATLTPLILHHHAVSITAIVLVSGLLGFCQERGTPAIKQIQKLI